MEYGNNTDPHGGFLTEYYCPYCGKWVLDKLVEGKWCDSCNNTLREIDNNEYKEGEVMMDTVVKDNCENLQDCGDCKKCPDKRDLPILFSEFRTYHILSNKNVVCPKCGGEGVVYKRDKLNRVLGSKPCSKCKGKNVVKKHMGRVMVCRRRSDSNNLTGVSKLYLGMAFCSDKDTFCKETGKTKSFGESFGGNSYKTTIERFKSEADRTQTSFHKCMEKFIKKSILDASVNHVVNGKAFPVSWMEKVTLENIV